MLVAWVPTIGWCHLLDISEKIKVKKNRTWSGVFTPPFNHFVIFLAQFGPFWIQIHLMGPGRHFGASSPMWGNEIRDLQWYVMHKWF